MSEGERDRHKDENNSQPSSMGIEQYNRKEKKTTAAGGLKLSFSIRHSHHPLFPKKTRNKRYIRTYTFCVRTLANCTSSMRCEERASGGAEGESQPVSWEKGEGRGGGTAWLVRWERRERRREGEEKGRVVGR